jgi:hypothetical protein
MKRAISVLVGVLILLAVGWYVGHRPVSGLNDHIARIEAEARDKYVELENRAQVAEARGYLWQARAEILLAANDVSKMNYGTANERAVQARDLLTRAVGIPGLTLDVSGVRDMVDSAVGKIGAMEPDCQSVLLRAASELGRLLEKVGAA